MIELSGIEELPTLSDGRLVLRPWRPEDVPACAEMCDDQGTSRWLPAMPFPYTLAVGEEWVADAERKWREDRWANFAVMLAGSSVDGDGGAAGAGVAGTLVGSCGITVNTGKQSGEIGYLVHRDYRRRGIATACVRLLTAWGFDDLELARLEIRADVRNAASWRTIIASGYHFEGVLLSCMAVKDERCDDALYSLLPGDTRPPEKPLPDPHFEDGRLAVRPFEADDAPAVQAACDVPEVAHWITQLPTPYTLTDARDFIAGSRRRIAAGDQARLAVTDAASGELLGSVSLDVYRDRQAGEIGYWVKRDARRRGVALAAARLMVRWAFLEVGLERLELLTYPGNEASPTLAGKLGFQREGVLRGFQPVEPGKSRDGRFAEHLPDGSLPPRDDEVQYALLRSEWEQAGGAG